MRRCSAGTSTPARVSVRVVPVSCTSPSSGGRRPAIDSTRVVLPLPERPKSAVTPGVGASKRAVRVKAPRRLRTETRSMAQWLAAQAAPHAPYQELGGEETGESEDEGQDREPQRQCIARR